MTAGRFGRQLTLFGAAVLLTVPLSIESAQARSRSNADGASRAAAAIHQGMLSARSQYGSWRHGYVRTYGGGRLQCVPFARENSGIELTGNASHWWAAAQGVYERGAKPEVGSILTFRATGHMRLGHVAVVTNVVNSRTIEIDHANWAGGIHRGMTVVDVSSGNDWSAVRATVPSTGTLGSVYPTYGFIYDRPDGGTMVANTGVTAGTASATPVTAPPVTATAVTSGAEEVAEAGPADEAVATTRHRRHRADRHARWFTPRASVYRVRMNFAPSHGHSHRGRHRT